MKPIKEGYYRPAGLFDQKAVHFMERIPAPTPEQTAATVALINHQPDATRLREMLGIQ